MMDEDTKKLLNQIAQSLNSIDERLALLITKTNGKLPDKLDDSAKEIFWKQFLIGRGYEN